jgi:hypothetical protein
MKIACALFTAVGVATVAGGASAGTAPQAPLTPVRLACILPAADNPPWLTSCVVLKLRVAVPFHVPALCSPGRGKTPVACARRR